MKKRIFIFIIIFLLLSLSFSLAEQDFILKKITASAVSDSWFSKMIDFFKNLFGQDTKAVSINSCENCIDSGNAFCTISLESGQCNLENFDAGIGLGTFSQECSANNGALIKVKKECPNHVVECSDLSGDQQECTQSGITCYWDNTCKTACPEDKEPDFQNNCQLKTIPEETPVEKPAEPTAPVACSSKLTASDCSADSTCVFYAGDYCTESFKIVSSSDCQYLLSTTDCLKLSNLCKFETTCIPIPDTTPINGVCGSSNTKSFETKPTTNLCSIGFSSSVQFYDAWQWQCNGQNGGTNAECSAVYIEPTSLTHGLCNHTLNAKTVLAVPNNEKLCLIGTKSAYQETATAWNWNCTGTDNVNVSCSAVKTSNAICNQNYNNKTIASVPNDATICTTGIKSDYLTNETTWTWNCASENNIKISCSALKLCNQSLCLEGKICDSTANSCRDYLTLTLNEPSKEKYCINESIYLSFSSLSNRNISNYTILFSSTNYTASLNLSSNLSQFNKTINLGLIITNKNLSSLSFSLNSTLSYYNLSSSISKTISIYNLTHSYCTGYTPTKFVIPPQLTPPEESYQDLNLAVGADINSQEQNQGASGIVSEQDQQESGSLVWLIWSVSLLILIGAGITVYILLKRRKKNQPELPSESDLIKKQDSNLSDFNQETQPKINQEVLDYVKKCRTLGFKDEQIKAELLKSGWDSNTIESSLKSGS